MWVFLSYEAYAKTMKDVFGALPFQHGFKKRPEIAAGSINAKVAEATGGNIKELMPPGIRRIEQLIT